MAEGDYPSAWPSGRWDATSWILTPVGSPPSESAVGSALARYTSPSSLPYSCLGLPPPPSCCPSPPRCQDRAPTLAQLHRGFIFFNFSFSYSLRIPSSQYLLLQVHFSGIILVLSRVRSSFLHRQKTVLPFLPLSFHFSFSFFTSPFLIFSLMLAVSSSFV